MFVEGGNMDGGPKGRLVASVLLIAILVAGCGQDGGAAASTAARETPDTTGQAAATTGQAAATTGQAGADIIRFNFAPDPVWDYLADTAALAQWEEENNIRIVTSATWDFFTYFAGGHGDIASMGTYHIPLLEEEAGVSAVAFGQYNLQRIPFFRRAGDPYETLADVPKGSTVCVSEPLGDTVVWSVIADQLHDLNFRVGEGDFNVVIQDHFLMPEDLLRGDCEIAAFIPEAGIPFLRRGEIEVMYDGRAAWQIYQDVCDCDHRGIMSNLFVATEEWYDANPELAKAFLELWQRGLDLWQTDKEFIIESYPQHFAIEDPKDVDYTIEYMSGDDDWFTETVYLDEEWIAEEVKFYDYMIEAGWLEEPFEAPRFDAVAP